jgi:hypothetical protein
MDSNYLTSSTQIIIYLYWIGFLIVVLNDKCITRYFIDLKNNKRNIILNLQIVYTIFISNLSIY